MRVLDWVYKAAGALAAFFLVMMAVITLAQITGRLLHLQVRDADVFASFCLAATSFLALAYTLRSGGHIRVNLLISRLPARGRRFFEAWCLLFSTAAIGFFAWYTVRMVWDSWDFGDLSSGMIGVPLWIPQLGMAAGVILLEVAFIEECIRFLRRQPQSYDASGGGAAEPGFSE